VEYPNPKEISSGLDPDIIQVNLQDDIEAQKDNDIIRLPYNIKLTKVIPT
jgi:hypothetical protein